MTTSLKGWNLAEKIEAVVIETGGNEGVAVAKGVVGFAPVRIEPHEAKRGLPSVKSLDTHQLLQAGTPPALGEITWRVGLPISALILSLLAIPLSFVNPRSGRSLNLILALLVYVIYSNCMSVVQAWVVQGRVGIVTGIFGLHLFMLVLLAALFFRRVAVFSLWRGLR